MANETRGARKHHYVPQFYLRGFAGDKGQLLVTDRPSGKTFRTNPSNVAAQRDFNTVNIPETDPQIVEKGLAEFEGEVAPALERIKAEKSLSNGADRQLLMSFICGLAIRNPRQRSTINDFVGEVVQRVADLTFATEERWASQVEKMKKDGVWDESSNVTYADMKKFIDERNYKIEVAPEFNIKTEIEQHANLVEHISARKWQMVAAKLGSGGFITTDVPVCLRWSDDRDHGFYAPGFGVANTQVLFPLSSDLAIMGSFEGKEDVVEADIFTVSSINSVTISNARNQVYSKDTSFHYMRPFPMEMGSGATLSQDEEFIKAGTVKEDNVLPLRTK